MINISEVIETNKMIEQENFDVRTITMGINLLDCASTNLDELCQNIHNKITRLAKNLVAKKSPRSLVCLSSTSVSPSLLSRW